LEWVGWRAVAGRKPNLQPGIGAALPPERRFFSSSLLRLGRLTSRRSRHGKRRAADWPLWKHLSIRRSWFDAIHNCWWRQRICRNGALPKRISSNWPARYPSTSRSLQTNHPRNAEPAAPDVFRENAEHCAEGCCAESIQVAQHGSGTRYRLGRGSCAVPNAGSGMPISSLPGAALI